MTNKTITLDLSLVQMTVDLLHDLRSGSAVERKLRAAEAEPVPPAGGEPMPSRPYASEEDQSSMTDYEIGLGHGGCEMWDKFQPNVTRLQAEVAEEKKWRESAEGGWREANKVIAMQRERLDALQSEVERLRERSGSHKSLCAKHAEILKEREALQSELTKARELLKEADDFLYIMADHDSYARLAYQHGQEWNRPINELRGRICTALANQSAPADKGQGEPVAIGTLRRDANEQIVFDAVGDPHIKDGMSVFAEQPAPVAVAMPLSMHPEDFTTYPEAHCEGWNACIDEVARLNQIKQ